MPVTSCEGGNIDLGRRGSRLRGNDEKGHWKTSELRFDDRPQDGIVPDGIRRRFI